MVDLSSDLNSVLLFPQHLHIPNIPNTHKSLQTFFQNFLGDPGKRVPVDSPGEDFDGTGFPIPEKRAYHLRSSITILICGHMSRDTRCGILGPILQKEFRHFIAQDVQRCRDRAGNVVSTTHKDGNHPVEHSLEHTIVGLTSHIGGHAFAGNVVIYLPPRWKTEDGESLSPLAGKGIWYGRVEPQHVWGIMEETVKKGRIIEELLRGVHDPKLWLYDTVPKHAKLENKDSSVNLYRLVEA